MIVIEIMSDTNKHVHQFDTNNSKVRKHKAKKKRRKSDKVTFDISAEYSNVKVSNDKEVFDKKYVGS